ncbi:MAG: hypothetical protein NVSMB65_07180 [Chloroflexota bacterium]
MGHHTTGTTGTPAMAETRAPIPVTLYGKPGCHLCEDAEVLLALLAGTYPLAVSQVDITTDPDLFERYKWEIPVIATPHGQVGGRVTAAALRRLFEQER